MLAERQPMKHETTFTHEKSTKNTERYQEQPEPGKPPIIGTLYVQRWALGTPLPKTLKVTIETQD